VAFTKGNLIFLRNWGYVYALNQKKDGSSAVVGKFGVAPLPGITVLAFPASVVTRRPSPSTRRTRARRSIS
jgi:hypothetical protein